MSRYDVVIAGAGVNALSCGALLTKYGLKVCLVERNPWVGGGAVTREVTEPGFKHDLFGSSHVWIQANQDFKDLLEPELVKHGLKYIPSTDHITGHPDKSGGPGIVIYKDIDKTVESIAQYSKADAQKYRDVYDHFDAVKDGFVKAFFSPPSAPSTTMRALETSKEGLQRLQEFNLSARAWVEYNFENDFVKSVMLNWALAPQILPEQEGAGQSFYIMIPAIHVYGQAIPEGGSQELPNAMVRYIEASGGRVITGATVEEIIIEDGEARGLKLHSGEAILADRAVVSSLEPKQTFLKLCGEDKLEPDFAGAVKRFSFGKVTICRMHLALSEPPAFLNGDDMSQCSFHRIVDSMPQMMQQYADISLGKPPQDPFLWSACWTLLDPTRAPDGKHTLIFDTYVPNWLADGRKWEDIAEDYAHNVLLKKLQQYAPNINKDTILGEYIETKESLEQANLSFVDGTTNGGERIAAQLGAFRPLPGYAHYRSPFKGLYMTGPHCHPGGGISAGGTVAGNVMLEDFGLKPKSN
ncbi:MAG: NAD(P)/FAD-dependent oxidoreductase [Hyphomonadaceae bacterium]|nr:NAD(P)/FAD-dependent oxidoreductase [Hyphomonadaceae bacterium]